MLAEEGLGPPTSSKPPGPSMTGRLGLTPVTVPLPRLSTVITSSTEPPVQTLLWSKARAQESCPAGVKVGEIVGEPVKDAVGVAVPVAVGVALRVALLVKVTLSVKVGVAVG